MLFRRSRLPLDAHGPRIFGIFYGMPEYLRFIILLVAGWINSDQQKIIDYLLEELRVYREHFKGRRLRFTDEQRRRLGVKAKALGRRTFEQFASPGDQGVYGTLPHREKPSGIG